MMFDRLLGCIDNNNVHAMNWRDPNSDVRLATAVLLFSVVPADYQNLPIEGEVLVRELGALVNLWREPLPSVMANHRFSPVQLC
jgi:uncharacterized tellurite resistance protein B-like protein